MYVIDTNTLIYFFKGVGRVAEIMLIKAPADIAVPSIVLFELETGIAKSNSPQKRRKQLDEFIQLIKVLPFGAKEAIIASNIRVKLELVGKPIGPYDVLIAATALSNDAVLVTHNQKEFRRIANLKSEDWY